ncbi:MAG: 30S ribosome-binding factor RbfA [Lentisphaerae bacterium]|jgi:ribosome-binding factor A|nr:30S ribosome-binding factor RbfA [Lentisphaerota bacterium]
MSVDRITRLNALLQRELGQLVVTYVAPEMPGVLITITGVRVASNLRSATVFFSVYGTDAEDQSEKVLALLQKKRALLQSAIATKVLMKYTPVLRFKYDATPARADRVMEILAELQLSEQDSEHNV